MNRQTLVAIAGSIALTAGCTLPSEESATREPSRDVPFQLTETTAADTGTVPGDGDVDVKMFLVRDERLTIVNRGTSPADPAHVLALLAEGPSQAETDAGLRTALVADLAKIVTIDGDLITIDLDDEFNALAPTEQRLALAQITFAMTQLASISRVKFLVAGQPASVPRGDGSSTDGPVSPDDYRDFAPL